MLLGALKQHLVHISLNAIIFNQFHVGKFQLIPSAAHCYDVPLEEKSLSPPISADCLSSCQKYLN